MGETVWTVCVCGGGGLGCRQASEPEASMMLGTEWAFRKGKASREDHVGFGHTEVTYEPVKTNSMEMRQKPNGPTEALASLSWAPGTVSCLAPTLSQPLRVHSPHSGQRTLKYTQVTALPDFSCSLPSHHHPYHRPPVFDAFWTLPTAHSCSGPLI